MNDARSMNVLRVNSCGDALSSTENWPEKKETRNTATKKQVNIFVHDGQLFLHTMASSNTRLFARLNSNGFLK